VPVDERRQLVPEGVDVEVAGEQLDRDRAAIGEHREEHVLDADELVPPGRRLLGAVGQDPLQPWVPTSPTRPKSGWGRCARSEPSVFTVIGDRTGADSRMVENESEMRDPCANDITGWSRRIDGTTR
jgi:hypothetical protein